jgi:hypothetical protein
VKTNGVFDYQLSAVLTREQSKERRRAGEQSSLYIGGWSGDQPKRDHASAVTKMWEKMCEKVCEKV